MRRRRPLTGVAYSQDLDLYSVPSPEYPNILAVAHGTSVRGHLQGETPRNGAHLRDVIIAVAYGYRAAK